MNRSSKFVRPRRWNFSPATRLLAILSFCACLIAASSLPAPGQQEPPLLAPDQPVEREIAGGQSHSYRLALAAGQYLRVEVEQRGANVAVTLFGADGREIAASDVFGSTLEWVSLIAETPVELRLEIRAADPKPAVGRYAVKIAELRAAVESDRQRVAAEQAFHSGERLRGQKSKESRQSAVGKYEEALALYRALGDRRGEAFALFGLSASLNLSGERRKALEHYQQALPRMQALSERLAESEVLYNLGHLSNALNERRQAVEYFDQALALIRALGDRPREAQTLTSLGAISNAVNEKQKALEYFDQALALARSLGDRRREAQTLFSLSVVHASIGDRRQSVEIQQQTLPILRELGDRAEEGRTLAAIGANYEALGEKQKAIEYLLQALPLLRSEGNQDSEAYALYILGLAYDTINERQKAVEAFNQALAIRKAIGHRGGEAARLRNLGNLYDGLGDLRQALDLQRQALALYEKEKDYSGVAGTLRNIGLLHDRLGEKRKAAEHFQRALPLFRLGPDRQSHARLLTNLGKVLSEAGDHDQALAHLNEALPMVRRLNNRFFELLALYWIARSERERGNLAVARATVEEALGLIEGMRGNYYQPELRSAGFSRAQEYYELEMDLLLRLAPSQPDQNLVAAALETSERARARTLLDLLAEARIEIRQGIAPELKRREQEHQARLTSIQNQLIQARLQARPDQRRITALQEELKQAGQQREQIEREIRREYPRYADLQYPAPLNAEAIRASLDEQTALLQYALGGESSFLFVVTRQSVRGHRLPKAEEIAALVQEVRRTLGQPGRREFADYARAARRLYDLLILPAAGDIARKQRLLIAPDQSLYYLPFESLLAKEAVVAAGGYRDLDFLIKRWDVGYAPSASVLASLRQNKREPNAAATKQFLAFADPVYQLGGQTDLAKAPKKPAVESSSQLALRSLFEQEGRWELARLAESRREVKQIAQLYRPDQVSLHLGQEAKEENVKTSADLGVARRIHFAAHGLISERQPQYSGLALTLDDDPREDGLLQAYEVFNLKLQADLVVLSACQTGLGKELRGEGMIGLTRAFMYAGAPSVVVSLWRVTDASTAELMVEFYRQLDRTNDKAAALRRAKLELMRNPRYGHPYYWAPFVLVGEPK